MSNEIDWQLPRGLRILHFFGVIAFALGIAKYFGGIDVVPADLMASPPSAFELIAVGVSLQAPAVIYQGRKAINWLRAKRSSNSDQTR